MTIVRFSRVAGRRDPAGELPPEIAFLIGYGIAPAILVEAARLATRSGVTADLALLASGGVSEATFYRALARRLDIPFLERPVAVMAEGALQLVLEADLAALRPNPDGFTHVLAPRGAVIAALLDSRRRLDAGRPRYVLATPRQYQGLVRRAYADRTARDVSHALPQRAPQLSSLTGITAKQTVALCLTSAAAGFTLGAAPFLLALAAGAVFLSAILLRLAAAAASRPARAIAATRRDADAALPVYTVLVPLFREARVARPLVRALDRLDYPPARLDIVILLETGDAATRDALVALALPTRYRIVTVPPGHPRTKPRALNAGLEAARGTFIVVYDAEDEPDPDQLRAAVAHFARAPDRVACLQAKLAIRDTDDSLLAKLFAIEYCALFDVVNSGLAALRLPILLGGTSNHFRTAVLRRLFGWDAWNVTEDADLGLRLARSGYDVDMLDSTTFEEAPHTWRAWRKQRTRWLKGFMQTLAVHSRAPARLVAEVGMMGSVACICPLVGTILGALFGPLFAVAMIWRIAAGPLPGGASGLQIAAVAMTWAVFGLGIASALGPILIGRLRRPWLRLWPSMAALPLYWLMLSVAAWLALLDLARWPFRWAKTEHGLGDAALRRTQNLASPMRATADSGKGPLSMMQRRPLGAR